MTILPKTGLTSWTVLGQSWPVIIRRGSFANGSYGNPYGKRMHKRLVRLSWSPKKLTTCHVRGCVDRLAVDNSRYDRKR